MKRRRWKVGSATPPKVSDAFQRAPGSVDNSTARSVVPVEPDEPTLSESRALWNQPIQRQLLFLPAAAAFIWWKWLGFSGLSWLVVVAAVPTTVLYFRSVSRATDPDAEAPHELPPLPAKYREGE